jgi:hypothetical protein
MSKVDDDPGGRRPAGVAVAARARDDAYLLLRRPFDDARDVRGVDGANDSERVNAVVVGVERQAKAGVQRTARRNDLAAERVRERAEPRIRRGVRRSRRAEKRRDTRAANEQRAPVEATQPLSLSRRRRCGCART